MYDPSQPPLISETLLKNRRSLEDLAYKRSLQLATHVKRKRVIRGEDIKIRRPEQFVTEFNIRQGSQNKMKRLQRQAERKTKSLLGNLQVKNTIGLVIRIHEGRHSSKEIKDELKKLGLYKKYDAIFMKLDEDTIRKLKGLDTYLSYGYISPNSVHQLIHRRAFTNINGITRPLTDNLTIEQYLGNKGILCTNDLCHEIHSIGTYYQDAINILNSFHLSAPLGKFEKEILHQYDEIEKHGGFTNNLDEFLGKVL